jgi:hypothetical protein
MKNSLLFAMLLFSFQTTAQQIVIDDPVNSSEHITLGSITKLSDGSYVSVGSNLTPQALVIQIDAFGTGSAWTKVCGQYSTALNVKQSPNGNVIVCGWWNDGNAFVTSFDSQNGSTIWSKTFGTDSVEVFSSIDIDQDGNVYAVGNKRYSWGDDREIYMKLDASGNVLWSVQANRGPNTSSRAEYCYHKGDSLIVVGTSYLAGDGFSNGSVSVTVLSSSDGSLISHRMYGTHNPDIVLDAVANEYGIFILCSLGNSTSPLLLMKIGWSSLEFSCDPVEISGFDYSFRTASLIVDGSDVFVSGGVLEFGDVSESSYVMRFNQNLVFGWAKKMTIPNSHSTAGAGLGGGIVTAHKKATGESVLGFMGNSGGTTCNPVNSMGNLNIQPQLHSSGMPHAGFSLMSASYTVGAMSFENDTLSVTPCVAILPVELVSFTGEKDGETSVLSWQTASERNVSHFSVQRSEDGFQWKEIGTVNATGNSQQLQSYEFVDDNPLLGDNYYRISSVDLDGTLEFSDIVVLSFDRSANLIVYPNPGAAGEALNVKGEFQTLVALDQLGRHVPVQRNGQQLAVQAGPGVYLLTFLSADGASETVRVVIN